MYRGRNQLRPIASPARHLDPGPADHALAAEADHAGDATSGTSVHHAVEVHEADRLAGAVRVRDARPQAAGDEGQVRIGVLRLDGALHRVEVLTSFELVVFVAGAFWKQRPVGLHVRAHLGGGQPRRDAAIDEAGRGELAWRAVARFDQLQQQQVGNVGNIFGVVAKRGSSGRAEGRGCCAEGNSTGLPHFSSK